MSARPIRNFLQLLGLLERGNFSAALDEKLTHTIETLQAMPSEKGKAVVTLTVEIAYDKGRIDILPAVKCKLPDDKAFSRTPFWAIDGALSTQHPSQMDMWSTPRDTAAPRDDAQSRDAAS